MRKTLFAALLSLALVWIPTVAPAQYIPHTLVWLVFAAKGDGTYEDKPFMGVGYAGDAFPTKQGCQDFGELHLPNVIKQLELIAAPAKAGKDFDVKVGCKPSDPGTDA